MTLQVKLEDQLQPILNFPVPALASERWLAEVGSRLQRFFSPWRWPESHARRRGCLAWITGRVHCSHPVYTVAQVLWTRPAIEPKLRMIE